MSNRERKLILILEDEEIIRIGISCMLRRAGYETHHLEDKALGLKWMRAFLPDLVLSDIKSAGMDGFEFLEQIKADPRISHIPFIYETGYSSLEVALLSKRMGAADFVSKPYELPDLLASIQRALDDETTNELEHAAMAQHQRKTILVLDDEESLRITLCTELEEAGYRTHQCEDKREGFEWMCENRPDVVISDIISPGMNGLELLQRMMDDPLAAGIPMLILSGRTEPRYTKEAKLLGAADVIAKPYELRDLLAKIDNVLKGVDR